MVAPIQPQDMPNSKDENVELVQQYFFLSRPRKRDQVVRQRAHFQYRCAKHKERMGHARLYQTPCIGQNNTEVVKNKMNSRSAVP